MHWLAWLLVSNVSIAVIEYVYRTAKFESFVSALPYLFLPILIGQAGLFYGFRGAPNLLFAGAVFTVINVAFRIVNSYYLNESLNWMNWCGVVLLVTATILLKIK